MLSLFPNRPMTFAEVVSGFRAHPRVLTSVLSRSPWKEHYLDTYRHIAQVIDAQDREKLDSVVPLELTRQICAACPAKFYLRSDGWLSAHPPQDKCTYRVLSALEVHARFGPAVIDEANESGSARVA
ncbi:MAG: hypothetical protein ACLGHA_11135 [Gammaproteobacteria bacterium]